MCTDQEHHTAAFIAAKLQEFGIPIMTGVAKTGVVGLIMGEAGPGPCIALRADMDALPIREETGCESVMWVSTTTAGYTSFYPRCVTSLQLL